MKTPPKRIPPTIYPLRIEQDYGSDLVRQFTSWWNEVIQILGLALQVNLSAARQDAAFDSLFEQARQKWGEAVEQFRAHIQRAAAGVDRIAQLSLAHQIDTAADPVINKLAVNPLASDPRILAEISDFTAENVRLIKDIGEQSATRLEALITDYVKSGRQTKYLIKDLQRVYDYSQRRARVIARDQIGKLNGNLNRVRQRAAGANYYTWHTAQDGRVRPEHARREGERFSWDSPPPDGHPGQPIQCRCTPIPVFEPEDFGLSPEDTGLERQEQAAKAARRARQIAQRQAHTQVALARIAQARQAEARALSPSYPPIP